MKYSSKMDTYACSRAGSFSPRLAHVASRSYSPLFTVTLILQKSDRGRFPFSIPRDTTGSSTARPVCAPLRSALSERPLDLQRRCPLPCRCLLVQERKPLAGLIAQKNLCTRGFPVYRGWICISLLQINFTCCIAVDHIVCLGLFRLQIDLDIFHIADFLLQNLCPDLFHFLKDLFI